MKKHIHKLTKVSEQEGYTIIIIGDKMHDEVRGIIGQLKSEAIIIDDIENIPLKKIRKIKKAAIAVQSTQNTETALRIVELLKGYIKELEFFNTICKPTRIKQQEMKVMPLKNDVMIIIGSESSANTKRLYQICKSVQKNTSYSKHEIIVIDNGSTDGSVKMLKERKRKGIVQKLV